MKNFLMITGAGGFIGGNLSNYLSTKYKYHSDFKYRGVLYGSYIKTIDNKLKIIEFNARLGDPEAINIFELMEEFRYLDFINCRLPTLMNNQ